MRQKTRISIDARVTPHLDRYREFLQRVTGEPPPSRSELAEEAIVSHLERAWQDVIVTAGLDK